jgi:hypothetical protein
LPESRGATRDFTLNDNSNVPLTSQLLPNPLRRVSCSVILLPSAPRPIPASSIRRLIDSQPRTSGSDSPSRSGLHNRGHAPLRPPVPPSLRFAASGTTGTSFQSAGPFLIDSSSHRFPSTRLRFSVHLLFRHPRSIEHASLRFPASPSIPPPVNIHQAVSRSISSRRYWP